jgi:hypothetical protein
MAFVQGRWNTPPPELEHVWYWFLDLHAGRGFDSNGQAQAISYIEIEAWARLRDTEPTPFEVEVIRTLDRSFCSGEFAAPKGGDIKGLMSTKAAVQKANRRDG